MTQTTLKNVQFRPAKKSDCRMIATLYSISSDGVADYVWTTLAKEGEDILGVGQKRYEREDTNFSYRNCTIASIDEKIIGMIVAFPMRVDKTIDFSKEDPVLVPYLKLEEDESYYVCGVSLFEEYRGQGVGRQFMQLAEDQARAKGFNKLSLIVFEQNEPAKRLYERLGYKEVARETIVPHPLIHYTGDALLMVKTI